MFHIVIPARYGSTRLPGKALLPIADKPMLAWVWERAQAAAAQSVWVATDDERIRDQMTEYGAQVMMTRADHASGTDRLAEVAERAGFAEGEVVVNLQGDEPLMPVANIRRVAAMLAETPEAHMATLMEPLAESDRDNPSVVKVVASASGRALYFSRATIPFNRDGQAAVAMWRHIGLYAYRVGFLRRFVSWPPTALEQSESLEQLRALAHDCHIQIEPACEPVPPGVDTPEDLAHIRQLLSDGS